MTRRRLDLELVRRKLASSRTEAQAAIARGEVLVGGAPASNAARMVGPGEPVVLTAPPPRFVSRGGEKLDSALERFGVEVGGKSALDIGASTGGFTDCLLQRGARSVVAVDVGYGQIHERLRADSRVDVRERLNIRHVTLNELSGEAFEVITIDVSFISLRTIFPVIAGFLAPGGDLVALVKPQFEAGKIEVSKGKGVIRDPDIWRDVLESVLGAASREGLDVLGVMISPLLGGEGNVEFLAWMRAQTTKTEENSLVDLDLDDVLARAAALSGAKSESGDQ